jgi:nitric oxide reductase NorD protein
MFPNEFQRLDEKKITPFLYKIMVTHKFLQTELGTYRLDPKKIHVVETVGPSKTDKSPDQENTPPLFLFLNRFSDPVLGEDLFNLAESIRIEAWIGEYLPGLYREMNRLKKNLWLKRKIDADLSPKSRIMNDLIRIWLTGDGSSPKDLDGEKATREIYQLMDLIRSPEAAVEETAMIVVKAYHAMDHIPGPYEPVAPVPFIGYLRPEEAERGRLKRREATRVQFREELAKMIEDLPQCEQVEIEIPGMPEADEDHIKKTPQQQIPYELFLDGIPVPIPEAMGKIIKDIYEDLGAIPSDYMSVTDDMSGHFFRSLCQTTTGTSNVLSEHGAGVHVYDEWDYRRKGYRKRWVLLRESDAPVGDMAFSQGVLDQYRGMIQSIKRQFERIQMSQALLKRQKDGDRIDLDAAVEAFTDSRAGLNPSERLFSQIRRNKRDIATAFLIDLSGSTRGWINEMERTALLILSEALGVLKDRFAIYGFSGRTRKRCELFRIKGFEERYGETVKARISGLEPLDYTRLAPPIRHLTGILREVAARTRLMITLSDGKPDDYDIYKGQYGIEDTRQALLESRQAGIHPFCITIDRAEHAYLSHMYGLANYVFIDDIAKLPVKIPEIYRKLTT